VLRCAVVFCSVLQCVAVRGSVLQCVAVCCSVRQCVVVRDSVLQCVAVCCSVLQCVTVCGYAIGLLRARMYESFHKCIRISHVTHVQITHAQ